MKKSKTLNVDRIQKAQRLFTAKRDWNKFHTPKNLAMALVGEAAELVEVFQWLSEKQSLSVMKDPKTAKAVRHEVSDILFYLIRMADILKIDLESAFWEKFEHNSKKYPVHLSKGNAKKYTELRS